MLMTTNKTYTEEEVLKCMRVAWAISKGTKECGCMGMHIFRIPWSECREMHEDHMNTDMRTLLKDTL